MNNYCINLKKRKNKPYCKIKNREITFSICNECDNKEYKKFTSNKKSPIASGQQILAKMHILWRKHLLKK